MMKLQLLQPLFQQAVTTNNTAPLAQPTAPNLAPPPADSFTPSSKIRQGTKDPLTVLPGDLLKTITMLSEQLLAIQETKRIDLSKAYEYYLEMVASLTNTTSEKAKEALKKFATKESGSTIDEKIIAPLELNPPRPDFGEEFVWNPKNKV